jgi:hypothetical protein
MQKISRRKIIIKDEKSNKKSEGTERGIKYTSTVKRTRGFKRMEAKNVRRMEMIPYNSLIVGIDISKNIHSIWMSNMRKEPLGRMKIKHSEAGMEELIKVSNNIKE